MTVTFINEEDINWAGLVMEVLVGERRNQMCYPALVHPSALAT